MKTKKPLKLTLKLDAKKERARLKARIGAENFKVVQKAVAGPLRDIKEHFNAPDDLGGWPLGFDYYKDGACQNILGFDMGYYLISQICGLDLVVTFGDPKTLITKPAKRARKRAKESP